jgi:hypothetical protein
MFTKATASLVVLSGVVVDGSNQPPSGNYYQGDQYGNQYYGPPTPLFPTPKSLLDREYYKDLLTQFQGCKAHKCAKSPELYSEDISESIAILGEYTSCVTGCAAEQLFKAVSYYKHSLDRVFEVGSHKLAKVRDYLAMRDTEDEYDVIGNAAKIDESCCLPREYFVPWDNIVIPVKLVKADNNGEYKIEELTDLQNTQTDLGVDALERMVPVSMYIDLCTDAAEETAHPWNEYLKIVCSSRWVEYFELLQHNIGHLIMAPHPEKPAPTCNKQNEAEYKNPRAEAFINDLCVAVECVTQGEVGEIVTKLPIPIIKKTVYAQDLRDSCPVDKVVDTSTNDLGTVLFTVRYSRVPYQYLTYYTVTDGLPSLLHTKNDVSSIITKQADFNNVDFFSNIVEYECKFDLALAEKVSSTHFYKAPTDDMKKITLNAIQAAKVCPFGGLFEYCNMQQYATYLQKQLFDESECQTSQMTEAPTESPATLTTLACLYKTISLKCDCMEAVLNCYEHKHQFKNAMSETIGKAASVLCGFILCLRPKVYALFGGQHAIEQANIMRELLTQVGLSVPSGASMPPATFAFLAFGIGMIAFVATKMVSKKTRSLAQNEGYVHLI